jgi:hypothetical protein
MFFLQVSKLEKKEYTFSQEKYRELIICLWFQNQILVFFYCC